MCAEVSALSYKCDIEKAKVNQTGNKHCNSVVSVNSVIISSLQKLVGKCLNARQCQFFFLSLFSFFLFALTQPHTLFLSFDY